MEGFADSSRPGDEAKSSGQRMTAGWRMLALLVVAVPLSGIGGPRAAAEPPAPKVDLGRLLKLPDSYSQPLESRRGLGQAQWRSRFETARLDLRSARTALEKAQRELGEVATDSSQWSVAAPGTTPNPENTPLSYKLRQEIRRQRDVIERAERKLRALEIEADLAEVPAQWRAAEFGSQAPDFSANAAATDGD